MAAAVEEGWVAQDRVRSLQSDVEGVKTIMSENVERILARGEKLDDLMTKTEDLQASVRWQPLGLGSGLEGQSSESTVM
ncbi:vesicle-associated membrane protein 8-like [Rhincodon typus]|uniref:vesicle-associated membrane protein 8-like n=1 Tax=Rhincodon typus TaxID=259920 RepID=UPI00202E30ED|nr:vesicle-associated membrane protein 8-like [Rhincodon typus]